MVWARTDRPARMLVETATTDSFKAIRSAVYVDALPETDFTAKALLEGLPAGLELNRSELDGGFVPPDPQRAEHAESQRRIARLVHSPHSLPRDSRPR